MKLVERDGSFLSKPNPKDKRRNLYAVIGNKSSKILWKNKSYIVENIQNGCISNAKLQGDNIVRVKEEIRIEKINETNYNILKRYASNFLSNVREEDMIYMFEDCERYKSIVDEEYKNKYLKFGYIAFYGNLLAYTFTVDDFFGIPIILSDCLDYNLSKGLKLNIFKKMSKLIKDSVFRFEYAPDFLIDTSFKFANFNSNLDKEKEYGFYHGAYMTEYDMNCFVNKIEKTYFPKFTNINDVSIKCFKSKDLLNYYKTINKSFYFPVTWRTPASSSTVLGFHYFNLDDIYERRGKDKDYLVAIYKGFIIGVIKFGIWDNHQSVAYIDVNEVYRKKGIANLMISQIDKYIYPNYPMVLTDESDMGKMCHMAEKFKKAIKKVKVKTYEEALKSGRYD